MLLNVTASVVGEGIVVTVDGYSVVHVDDDDVIRILREGRLCWALTGKKTKKRK